MHYRKATMNDISLLAQLNQQLQEDEQHHCRMAIYELEVRMRGFLQSSYEAVIFEKEKTPVAYVLYRHDIDGIYLRQFFVTRNNRRQGIGKAAIQILLGEIFPQDRRVTLEVLTENKKAYQFWKSVGFEDYAIVMYHP